MMLTKEEYRKMLENSRYLEVVVRNGNGAFDFYTNFENTDIFYEFKQLINEHFELKKDYDYLNLKVIEQNMREMNYLIDRNNPPLKFEDLKVGMWLWDNRDKEYTHIHCYDNWHGRFWHYYCGSESPYFIYKDEFEETRFFLKEVKEDE